MLLVDKRKSQLPRGVVAVGKKLSLKLIKVSVCNIYFSHSFHILCLTDQMKGFVSIFQLLGRHIQRISLVFQPDLTTRYKQHTCLPILHNLGVHKPHMRKTYLNLYLTEPLQRNIEPHCGIFQPLRRNIEPHCGIIEPLWRNIEHLRIKAEHDRLSHCGNIESVYGINKSFSGNHNPTLQGESTCQTTVCKSFSDRENCGE